MKLVYNSNIINMLIMCIILLDASSYSYKNIYSNMTYANLVIVNPRFFINAFRANLDIFD